MIWELFPVIRDDSIFHGVNMAKVADVKLSWKKSPSADVDRIEIVTIINGNETKITAGKDIEAYTLEIAAGSSVQFSIVTYDTEGNKATSEIHSFTLGDLDVPLPATELTHAVLSVRDV